jgi:hypothetical protein
VERPEDELWCKELERLLQLGGLGGGTREELGGRLVNYVVSHGGGRMGHEIDLEKEERAPFKVAQEIVSILSS